VNFAGTLSAMQTSILRGSVYRDRSFICPRRDFEDDNRLCAGTLTAPLIHTAASISNRSAVAAGRLSRMPESTAQACAPASREPCLSIFNRCAAQIKYTLATAVD
jgi:hypothetical protein